VVGGWRRTSTWNLLVGEEVDSTERGGGGAGRCSSSCTSAAISTSTSTSTSEGCSSFLFHQDNRSKNQSSKDECE
jgi:hypothetical protein